MSDDELAKRRAKRSAEPPPEPFAGFHDVLGVQTCGMNCVDGWLLSPYNRMDAVRCPICNRIDRGPGARVG
jgi:hypothetical protein